MSSNKNQHNITLQENITNHMSSVDIFISRIEELKNEIEGYRNKLTDEQQEQINYCNSLLISSDALIIKVTDEQEIFDQEAYGKVYAKHMNQFANMVLRNLTIT